MKAMGFAVEALGSRDSGKDCKGVISQKRKLFCILFVRKLGASGVAIG